MKTFIAEIIPKIQRFSQKLEDLAKLTNHHWVSIGDIAEEKRVFIFRVNNQLLISVNGIVEKGTWDYIGNQSLLIETKNENYLMKQGFLDEDVFALKLDNTDKYTFFVNETRYKKELNNIEDILIFLEKKYTNIPSNKNINKATLRTYNNLGGGLFPNYCEEPPIKRRQTFGAVFHIIHIHFENSFSDFYFYHPKKNKYSYRKNQKGEVYFELKQDCIRDLYEDRLRNQSTRK
jgi:hypothetical protein